MSKRTEAKTIVPISKVRKVVQSLLERNGGPTNSTLDGHTYVFVRATDFVALEHYFKYATWK